MKVKVYHNGDDVFIAWKPEGFIPDCRGFSLLRRRNGVEETVSTWVGFEDDNPKLGERRASTNWPIQKYQWTDYMAQPGDTLQYRVSAMIGPDKNNLRVDAANSSDWTPKIKLTAEVSPRIWAYFNRGIVAAQWVTRRLEAMSDGALSTTLLTAIETPGNQLREYLYGPLGTRLFELLAEAATKKFEVYAALYELHDKQLEAALAKLGKRAHVVLANGSVKKKSEDQNAPARTKLRKKIDLHDRMTAPAFLGHNKFLVICNAQGDPRWVWTGSQNWTRTGLCTQANNSVLIDDPAVAGQFRKQWDALRTAGDAATTVLKNANSKPRKLKVDTTGLTLWFTSTVGQVDLEDARKVIKGAKQAIFFLMFNPGPKDTLLTSIIDSAQKGVGGSRLYVRGAINQDPGTSANPVQLFDQANRLKSDYDVVLPAAIDEPTKYFRRELKKLPKTFAMVHSKVVLVDPFGPHAVVLTGSHNLGPKASGKNDENLLIIRDASGLAAAYAANIMAVYNQYRWRMRLQKQPVSKRWKGLQDNDTWQRGYLKKGGAALREIDLWVGSL